MTKKILIAVISFFVFAAVLSGVVFAVQRKQVQTQQTQQMEYKESAKNDENEIAKGIEQAFYDKFPDWDHNISDVQVEVYKDNFAIGNMEQSYPDTESDTIVWFAAKEENKWKIVFYRGEGYGGICQNFEEHNFLRELTPDCWDNKKYVLIDTDNPDFFYKDNFSVEDKKEITSSFMSYIRKNDPSALRFYDGKDLYLGISDNTSNYFKGTVLIGGVENHSTPYILATKIEGEWQVLFQGQDFPDCEIANGYNFPVSMVRKCFYYDAGGKLQLVKR